MYVKLSYSPIEILINYNQLLFFLAGFFRTLPCLNKNVNIGFQLFLHDPNFGQKADSQTIRWMKLVLWMKACFSVSPKKGKRMLKIFSILWFWTVLLETPPQLSLSIIWCQVVCPLLQICSFLLCWVHC